MASQSTADALALVSQGQTARGVALLEAAARAGDVDALMQLAVWRIAGRPLPRDLDAARIYLRQAVAIGHVDGALMEVALTANGNGNASAADWPTALALLDTAAAGDPVAAQQRALVAAMRLLADGTPDRPPEGQALAAEPRVIHYPRFLTADECGHVASVGNDLLEPARIVDPRTGRAVPHPIRSSDNGLIGPAREDLVIRAINLRIAAATRTDVTQGEPLTVLRYRSGQQYRPHLDTIEGATNQRVRTFIIYLNEGFGGGETTFPLLPLTVRPRGGDAIMFDTVLPEGSPDPRARHAGNPVTAGAKWIATRWIRAQPVDSWTVHTA